MDICKLFSRSNGQEFWMKCKTFLCQYACFANAVKISVRPQREINNAVTSEDIPSSANVIQLEVLFVRSYDGHWPWISP